MSPLDNIRGLGKYEEPKDYALISINDKTGHLQVETNLTLSEVSAKLKDNLKQIAIRKEGIVRW